MNQGRVITAISEDAKSPYGFVSVAKLRRDFEVDIQKFGGEHEEED